MCLIFCANCSLERILIKLIFKPGVYWPAWFLSITFMQMSVSMCVCVCVCVCVHMHVCVYAREYVFAFKDINN